MSRSLRILRLAAQNIGILGDRSVEFGPFGAGVNVISGPNESGKSTLLRAVRAALFQKHGAKNETIRALQPKNNRKAAPRVEVEFELDGVAWQVEKQFMVGVSSRLSSHDGAVSLTGDDADMKLLSLLGAREPAKKGVNLDDMGVWSLLWVNQDEFATTEPSARLGDHTRETLALSIGGIVGDVMGGEHGTTLRRAIEDSYSELWTPKQTERATGKLLAARESRDRLEAEVRELEQKVRATETLGREFDQLEVERDQLMAEAVKLGNDVAECAKAASDAEAVEAERVSSEASLREAERLHRESEAKLLSRQGLRASIEGLDTALAARREPLAALMRSAARAASDDAVARECLSEARRVRDAAQQRVLALSSASAREKDRDELARLESALTAATASASRVQQLEEAQRKLPSQRDVEALQGLAQRRALLAEQAHRSATRVIVQRPGEGDATTAVAHRATVSLEGGALTIDPPREGFMRERAAWRAAAAKLEATLAAHLVSSVREARAQAEQRRRLDAVRDEAQRQLVELAPRGVAELALEHANAETRCAELARDLDDALACRSDLERCTQLVASVPVDDAEASRLEELGERVIKLEARASSGALRVTLRPLAAVRVQLGPREIARILTPGMEVRRSIATVTTLMVGDQLEVEIDPGADAHTLSADLDGARAALVEALARIGAASVEEVRSLARQRALHEADRARLERALAQKAPKGVEALSEALPRKRAAVDALRKRLDEARALDERAGNAERDARAFSITPAIYATLDALDQRTLEAESATRRLAGRVVSAEGALAARWQTPHDLLDDEGVDLGAARVEIVLGDAPVGVELSLVTREFERKLAEFGLTSLDATVRAHGAWQSHRADVEALERSIKELAPRGIPALASEVAAMRARVDPSEARADRVALAAQVELAQKQLAEAGADLAREEARAAATDPISRAANEARERAEREHDQIFAERAVKVTMLEAEITASPDVVLRVAFEEASQGRVAARARHEAALAAWEGTMPDVRKRDLDRARRILDAHSAAIDAKKLEMVRLHAQLEAAMPEGRYEKLAERRVELDEATSALERIERRAKALKLLRETAESAYADAQRKLMKPVYDEALPLLRLVRPGTTFTMKSDTLELDSVHRNGIEEEFGDLSGGAREQLALVVRIALARVFAAQGRRFPLVLDDVLGWTDDRRLRGVLNVLEQTARDTQVILLTCHPLRFRGIEGATNFELKAI